MKKQLLFVAMAAIAMASCSKDETSGVNQGGAMNFRASLGKTLSRATETTLDNLKGFNVTAIGDGKAYFTDLAVTNAGGTWTPAQTHYWPKYELQFFAYAPQDNKGVSIMPDAQKITDYTPAAAAVDQQDLVISYNKGTKELNEKTGVEMNFKHALSQIKIKAMNSNAKTMKVEIVGVKVANVSMKGTFTFPTTPTAADYVLANNWVAAAHANNGADKYEIKATGSVTLTADAAELMFGANGKTDENWMLVPQTQTAWDGGAKPEGSYLAVLCRICELDDKGNERKEIWPADHKTVTEVNGHNYAYSAVGAAMNWEPGKRYTYTLDFFGDNGGGGGQIDPIDPEKPGEDIVGGPIKFTVTVDGWQEAGDTNVGM